MKTSFNSFRLGSLLVFAMIGWFVIAGQVMAQRTESKTKSLLHLFAQQDSSEVFRQFNESVPPERREESLFNVWSDSKRNDEGTRVKENVLRYLSLDSNVAMQWQPETCLMAYGAAGIPNADVRLQAIDLLAKRNCGSVQEIMWAALGDVDDRIRSRAVEDLADSPDAYRVLTDYIRTREKGPGGSLSVSEAKNALSCKRERRGQAIRVVAQTLAVAKRLAEKQNRLPPQELDYLYAGKDLLQELPRSQWSTCLCEAWILSSELDSRPQHCAFRRCVLWLLSPNNPKYGEVRAMWSPRLEALVCAATRDEDAGVRYDAAVAILRHGGQEMALSLVYDKDKSVAARALAAVYGYHKEAAEFSKKVYEAYLREYGGQDDISTKQAQISLGIIDKQK